VDKGNTVGSRTVTTKATDWAYIAGFFDGDGSIMAQVKTSRDRMRDWRPMVTMCFYQDARHRKNLERIRNMLGIGYVTDRNDHMTELRIQGYSAVRRILSQMRPYLLFKRQQTSLVLKMLATLEGKRVNLLPRPARAHIADYIIGIRNANYLGHRRKYSDAQIRRLLSF
jgi:LAGLIDADG DNA endonuclease family protein